MDANQFKWPCNALLVDWRGAPGGFGTICGVSFHWAAGAPSAAKSCHAAREHRTGYSE
jgi:hypothetical protein